MMAATDWFAAYENDPDYLFEVVSVAVGEAIVGAMEQLDVNRTELAKRLGVSRPRVTQILAGDENLTLKTLVAVATALEARLDVRFVPPKAETAGALQHWQRVDTKPLAASNRTQLALAA